MKNLMFRLATGLASGATDYNNPEDVLKEAYYTFKNVMGTVLPIVIAVVLLVGMFFGISLGIKFAKAEDTDARDKAKGQLINLAIGVGVAAVILIIVNVLVTNDVFQNAFTFAGSAE